MSDFNNIAQKIASLTGDVLDGDTIHLIDSHITTALNKAAKRISVEKPVGHEELLIEQEPTLIGGEIETEVGYDYPRIALSTFEYPIVIPTFQFHNVRLSAVGHPFYAKAEPVNSFSALRLEATNLVPSYYIHENYIYLAYETSMLSMDEDFTALGAIQVTHYIYPTVNQFPALLEEYLIEELLPLVQADRGKQQVEKLDV